MFCTFSWNSPNNYKYYNIDSNNYNRAPIYDDDEIADYEDSFDPDYCQDEADRCYKKRDESFKEAAQSYRGRNGGIASYHSDEVRSLV